MANDVADFLANARSHSELPEGFVAPGVRRNPYDAPGWMPPAPDAAPPKELAGTYAGYRWRLERDWERTNLRSWDGFQREQREEAERNRPFGFTIDTSNLRRMEHDDAFSYAQNTLVRKYYPHVSWIGCEDHYYGRFSVPKGQEAIAVAFLNDFVEQFPEASGCDDNGEDYGKD